MRIRSLLFAPAVRADMLEKLPRSGADAVVIDCEDATPVSGKAEGRAFARELGTQLASVDDGPAVWVRVNGTDTPWFADDITHGLGPGLAGVILPKAETVAQLDEVDAALVAAGHADLPVLAGLESALGVADARLLLAHPRVVAGYFGAEDFIADMAGVRTTSNDEVAYARGHVALAGRLASVPVLDQVVAAYKDHDRFNREAAEARAMGFAGKLCIHPVQADLANRAFSPTEAEIVAARSVIDAYAEADAAGSGVIVVDGQMVDEALVAQARRVLELAAHG